MSEELVDVLRRWALGPDWRQTATAWPLKAVGGAVDPEHWPPGVRGKSGYPEITVHCDYEWAASVVCSPVSHRLTVLVPKGTRVVEVDP